MDDDNDGVLDENDLFPNGPQEYADIDGDGIGDNTDPDGDGVSNDHEEAQGTNPDDSTSLKDTVKPVLTLMGDRYNYGCPINRAL